MCGVKKIGPVWEIRRRGGGTGGYEVEVYGSRKAMCPFFPLPALSQKEAKRSVKNVSEGNEEKEGRGKDPLNKMDMGGEEPLAVSSS